jgi:hypothetical protein
MRKKANAQYAYHILPLRYAMLITAMKAAASGGFFARNAIKA